MAVPKKNENTKKELANKKVVFLGARVMGPAMAKAFIEKSILKPSQIILCNRSPEIVGSLSEKFPNCQTTTDCVYAASQADILVLCVPPQEYKPSLEQTAASLKRDSFVISVLAGVTLHSLQKEAPNVRFVRAMPNIGARVGEMASGYAFGAGFADESLRNQAVFLLESIGTAFELNESHLDAVTGVSGSSPAFVLMLVESLADGGLLHGLPKPIGLRLATQSVLATAKLLLESGEHPSVLRDSITSPGGATIAGVQTLEDEGFRGAVINAVDAVVAHTNELYSDSDEE